MSVVCVDCGEPKPEDDFPVSKRRSDGSILRRPQCKPCYAARSRAWNAAHREARSRINRRHYASNRGAMQERNRAKGKLRDWGPKNAARRAAAPSRWSTADVVHAHGSDCHLCGRPIDLDLAYPDPASFSRDHDVPIAKGGTNDLDNVKPAHLRCNLAKRDGRRLLLEVC